MASSWLCCILQPSRGIVGQPPHPRFPCIQHFGVSLTGWHQKACFVCFQVGARAHSLETLHPIIIVYNADEAAVQGLPEEGEPDEAPEAPAMGSPSPGEDETTQAAPPPKTPEKGHPASAVRGMIAQGLEMLKEVSSPEPAPKAPVRVGAPCVACLYMCCVCLCSPRSSRRGLQAVWKLVW